MVCRAHDCPKNHIEHYRIEDEGEDGAIHITKKATMHIYHHKVRSEEEVALLRGVEMEAMITPSK